MPDMLGQVGEATLGGELRLFRGCFSELDDSQSNG